MRTLHFSGRAVERVNINQSIKPPSEGIRSSVVRRQAHCTCLTFVLADTS